MASAPPDSGEEFTHCLHPAATRADLGGVQRVYGLAGGSRGEDALYSWAEGRSCISWNSIAKELFLRLAGEKN